MIPADEILEALDLSRAQPGSGFLEAIFLRFNDRVPFENASKIVRDVEVAEEPAKPRTPDVFWADHLERGTGGTCFARVAAFDALLTELGFKTRRVIGQVRNPEDHAALFVETPRGETIADVGFPLPVLIPAAPGLVESALAGLRIEAIRSGEGFRVTFEGGVPEGPRTLAIGTATVSPEAYRELWRRTFRKGAPFLQEVSLRRDLGQRVLSFARGEVRVDDRHSRLRIPLPAPRPSALSALFGVEEELLARALAIAGDPEPGSREAVLTSYLDTNASTGDAYGAIASPEGYRRLLQGVADIGDLTPTSSGFRLTLTPGSGAAPEARLEDEVSLDPESRCVAVIRRTAASEQRSSYRAQTREGRTYLMREVILPGAREDLLRNDSLRGRYAANLAVDLLAWGRML
ncbi:MAG: arylamine N-acetyltransferase [Thermoanaerobaculia bacterium]